MRYHYISIQMAETEKKIMTMNVREFVKQRKFSYPTSGGISQDSHLGKLWQFLPQLNI